MVDEDDDVCDGGGHDDVGAHDDEDTEFPA